MSSSNCKIDFKGSTEYYNQIKSLRLNNSHYNNSFYSGKSADITFTQNITNKIPSRFVQYTNKLITALLALQLIRRFTYRTTKANKQLAILLDKKLDNIEPHIKSFQGYCENIYAGYTKKLKELPKTEFSAQDTTISRIPSAKNNTELLEIEDEAFCNINQWFEDNYRNTAPSSVMEQVITIHKEFTNVINSIRNKVADNISEETSIQDIPANLTKGKNAETILTIFKEHRQRKIDVIDNSKTYTTNLFDADAKAYLGDILSKSDELSQKKYKMLTDLMERIKSRTNTEITPVKTSGISHHNITEMLPVNTPKSIYDNPVYKFLAIPDKTKEDYSDFVLSLSEKFSLRDMKIFKERLNLRAALSSAEYDKQWYNELANQVSDLCDKTEKTLTSVFAAPTKDIENISASEAEAKLSMLSKKFGYKNIGQMVSDILQRYGIRAEIYDSPAATLYRKYSETFAENYSTLMLNIERANKKLFDWREINESII